MRTHAPFRRAPWFSALLTVVGLALTSLFPVIGRTQQPSTPAAAASDAGIGVLRLRDNVFMLVGAGANVTMQTGPDGVLLVDSGSAAKADQLLRTIKSLSSAPIRYVINTGAGLDHSGGNTTIAAAGVNLRTGSQNPGVGAEIVAHLDVLNAMVKAMPARPSTDWPASTFLTPERDFYFNDEPVVISHQLDAHATGDSMVFLRRSEVISAGEVFNTTRYPIIHNERGGTINGVLAALNRIIALAVAKRNADGGTMVVPAYGRLSNEADVAEYRDMLTIIRDRVQDLIAKGRTLEQVQAARPTSDYDPLFDADPQWTTSMFVEAVYKSLANGKATSEGRR